MAEARRRVSDAELVALVVKAILEEGTVASQRRLAELVNRDLRRKQGHVTPARVRKLAVRSGLVGLTIRTRAGGPTPDLSSCPVCGAALKRTSNRTLTGERAETGYRCTKCPWWTGRELRVPHHYTFSARVSRGEGRQVTFVPGQRRL